jgi:hypothetical protein
MSCPCFAAVMEISGFPGQAVAQLVQQLVEEPRHAVIDLQVGRRRRLPLGDFAPAARDDLLSVFNHKVCEHQSSNASKPTESDAAQCSIQNSVGVQTIWATTRSST